jgi:RNA polymerase sigma factor (sigma-70 family)
MQLMGTEPTPARSPDTDPDTALMLAVAAGAVEALGPLFERHHRRLYQHFERLVGNRQAAEDLVQETFSRLLRYRHTFRGDAPFGAWLFLLARNVARDHWRANDRRARHELAVEVDAPTDEPGPLAALAQDEELRQLRRALQALPDETRELLLLARFQALPYEQIARQLGCTVGAVKVRVHRALRSLRAQFLLAPPGRPADA